MLENRVWFNIIRDASDSPNIYNDGLPHQRNKGLKSVQAIAIHQVAQQYSYLNFNNFKRDLLFLDFVSIHHARQLEFYNTFISRLGQNFSRINTNSLKMVPSAFMRVGLNQSDIFKSLSERNSNNQNKELFISLFRNGARLGMQGE